MLGCISSGFKPCYKWMTFNTLLIKTSCIRQIVSFKPCYKWMTFNTAFDNHLRGANALEF